MKYAFPVLLVLGFVVGLVFVGSRIWIAIQVRKAGERVEVGFFHPNYDRILERKYREIAKTRQLPIWPIYLYWVALLATIILACGLMFAIPR